MKPPVFSCPESSLPKKKIRYVSWIKHPDSVSGDLKKYKKTVEILQGIRIKSQQEEDAWTASAQITRREILNGFNNLVTEASKVSIMREVLGDKLLELGRFKKGSVYENFIRDRSADSIMQDIMTAVDKEHSEFTRLLNLYVKTSQDIISSVNNDMKVDSPPLQSSKRHKRGAQSKSLSAVSSIALPIPYISLSTEEETAGVKAASHFLQRYLKAENGYNKPHVPVTAIEREAEEEVDGTNPRRMVSRRMVAKEGEESSTGYNPNSPAELVVSAFTKVTDRSKFLGDISLFELFGELFPTIEMAEALKTTTGFELPLSADQYLRLSDVAYKAKLSTFVQHKVASAAALEVIATRGVTNIKKKKGARAVGDTVLLCPQPLPGSIRGRPLLLSGASYLPDSFVGYAGALPSDRGEKQAFASVNWDADVIQREKLETTAQQLRSGIIAASGVIASLQSEVSHFQSIAKEMAETLATVKECHEETQRYSEYERNYVLAKMSGDTPDWSNEYTESTVLKHRNGFGMGPLDSIGNDGFFSLGSKKSNGMNVNGKGKAKKSRGKASNRKPPVNRYDQQGNGVIISTHYVNTVPAVDQEQQQQMEDGIEPSVSPPDDETTGELKLSDKTYNMKSTSGNAKNTDAKGHDTISEIAHNGKVTITQPIQSLRPHRGS